MTPRTVEAQANASHQMDGSVSATEIALYVVLAAAVFISLGGYALAALRGFV
ncbi:hypothetical protein WG922_21410 [Ramlibacter sp. AN1015]|uniref:hypothetical protein n=1 Tax=Ramlibacter sp. AN1015 TaxID=3133428 RepID=UPI0030BF0755